MGEAALSPAAQMLAVGYNQAIEAERVRAVSCRGGETAALLHAATDWAADLANAFGADAHTAVALRARAFQASPDMPGEIDGRPFDFVFDGDGRFGPAFEAIVAGRWGLIPFCAVEEIRGDALDAGALELFLEAFFGEARHADNALSGCRPLRHLDRRGMRRRRDGERDRHERSDDGADDLDGHRRHGVGDQHRHADGADHDRQDRGVEALADDVVHLMDEVGAVTAAVLEATHD